MAQQYLDLDNLDIDKYLETAVEKTEKKRKKKEVTKKSGNFKPTDRFQDEEAEAKTLRKNHRKTNKEKEQQKLKEILTPSNYYLRDKTKKSIELYKSSNKRIKYHKERIEIIKEEIKKYIKIGNTEAVEKCNQELMILEKDYQQVMVAFEQTKKEDYTNLFDKIDINDIKETIKDIEKDLLTAQNNGDADKILELQDELKDYNYKLEEAENHNMWLEQKNEIKSKLTKINERIRTSNFNSITRILKNIKEELQIIENHKKNNFDDIEDYISVDNESFEEIENERNENIDNYESDFLMELSEICKLPVYDRIEQLAKLIHSILPTKNKTKFNLDKIKKLIIANDQKTIKVIINKFKNQEELDAYIQEKENLENELNELNSKLKKNANIIDYIFSYLDYDNSDENIQKESKDILIQYSIGWSEKIINRLVSQYNLYSTDKNLIDDLWAESAKVICEFADKWFKKRQEGSKQEWFNYIAPVIRQYLINFIIEWKNHGTISGTNARDIDFKNKKQIENIKASLIKEHGLNPLTGKLDEVWERYADEIINRTELLGIDNASTREALIGGNSGDEEKIDYADYASKSELDTIERGEALLVQNELIKNMGELLSLFDNNSKTGKKEKIFTDLEILIIKLELGLIYNQKTGKEYTGEEKAKIVSNFIIKNGLRRRFTGDSMTESNYTTLKQNIFGNSIEHSAYLEKVKRYEKGLGPKPSDSAKNSVLIEGKLTKILKSKPELFKAFSDLREYIKSSFVTELSLTETDLNNAIDSARLSELNKHQDSEFVSSVVNLDLILGDDVNSNDDNISDVWSEMVDFIGIDI